MADVKMPKLSDTMEEGTVLEWKTQSGTEVKKGDVLAEVESDKASFEIEAESEGVLQIVVDQGNPVPVGGLIARIGDGASEPAPTPQAEPAAQDGQQARAQPAGATATAAPAPPPSAPARAPSPPEGVRASPLARRLAREQGIDLTQVRGTGPAGRVVKDDVLAAAGQAPAAPSAPAAPAAAPAAPPAQAAPAAPAAAPARVPEPRPAQPVEAVEPNRMQSTIARRMAESKSTVPHFYVTVEARVDDVVRMRRQLKEAVPEAERVTATDFLTRACAIALTRFPEVNASWVEGRFERKRSVNIGIAVPPAEGMGLLVPVIHECERKDVIQLSIETRQAIERARAGRPAEADLVGGTFSISNLGMYGVDEFSAIINPPESAILAVGQIKDAPVVEDGQLTVGKVMRMTLSCDHRVFYGATAAEFLGEVKRLIENPVALLLPPPQT